MGKELLQPVGGVNVSVAGAYVPPVGVDGKALNGFNAINSFFSIAYTAYREWRTK